MIVEWIAAITAGFVGAGIALLGRKLTGGRLARAAIPVFAGIGMLGFTIWSEYSWFERTLASLPESVTVTTQIAEPSAYRPWTYVAPFTSRFAVVDTAAIRSNANLPEQRMTEVLLFTRLAPAAVLPVLVDCAERKRADIVDGMEFAENGAVINAEWRPAEADDNLLAAICGE